MMIEHRRMQWRACFVSLLVATAAGCQEPNPRSCIDGTCTDPSLPFCDVDGALAGEPETCIAVTCTPGEFTACRGDHAIRCNAQGTSYDLIRCERGCDDAGGGCRVCDPNQTVCANGKVQTCDATGDVIATETCPLGCFEDQPRCRELDPSNGLATYLDLAAEAPPLDSEMLRFDTGNGTVLDVASNSFIPLPTFIISQPNAPAMRVFVASAAHLREVTISARPNGSAGPGPAFVLLVKDVLRITGPVRVMPGTGSPTVGCDAEMGHFRYVVTGQAYLSTGPGGGGNATAGASGGGVSGYFPAAAGGSPVGNEQVIPLQGGCHGGDMDGRDINGVGGTEPSIFGGGAVQLVSATEIVVDGKLDVRGFRGACGPSQGEVIISAGDAGGSILLEAPTVTMTDRAALIAKGGGGGAYGTGPPSDDSAAPDPGLSCSYSGGIEPCSEGGTGGTATTPPTRAADVTRPGGTGNGYAGGGGGAVGRLRVNTATGAYVKSNLALEAAAVTSGIVQTK